MSRKELRQSTIARMVEQAEIEDINKKLNAMNKEMMKEQSVKDWYNTKTKNIHQMRAMRSAFSEKVLDAFTFEMLNCLYEASSNASIKQDWLVPIKDRIIMNFIKEQTSRDILSNMRKVSLPMSYLVKFVEDAHEKTMQDNKATLTDPSGEKVSLKINPEEKEKFIDKMDELKDDIEDVGDLVRTHVANSVEDFVVSNVEDKEQIKDTLLDVQDRINSIEEEDPELEEEIKEAMILRSKRKLHGIKSKEQPLFEQMVTSLSKLALKTKNKFILESSGINMDKVVPIAESMLTMVVLSEALGYTISKEDLNNIYK